MSSLPSCDTAVLFLNRC